MAGYAHEHEVRGGPRHLGTGPSFGTFFLAGLGAHLLAHVLYAPARVAVSVLDALVTEAALARIALELRYVLHRDVRNDLRGNLDLLDVGLDDDLEHLCTDNLLADIGITRHYVHRLARAGQHRKQRHE